MRLLPLVAGLTCAATVLAACSGGSTSKNTKTTGPTAGGTATLALLSTPTSLDPQITTANAVQIPATQIFEGLYAFDANFRPQPMLIKSAAVADNGKQYTFTLRDVTFQNGQPLTGNDVVASLQRAMSLPGNPMAQVKNLLTSITAPTKSTVVMAFKQPVGDLPSLLASYQSVILPASAVKGAGPKPIPEPELVGTGPYRIAQWQPGKLIELVRYNGYQPVDTTPSGNAGKKVAEIATLKFVPVSDPGARLAGVRTGQYQWADQMTPDLYGTLSKDPSLKLNLMPTGFTALYFNHMSGPMTNVDLRRAVQVAIDHNQIGLTQGPSATWKVTPELPTSTVGLASKVGVQNFNVHDAARAKALVKASGYDGQPLVLISTAGSPTGAAMIVVAEELTAIGLNVKLEQKDLVTGQHLREQKTGWAMAGGLEGGQIPNITQMPDILCGNGEGGYCSDQMNAAIEKFVEATTPAEQQTASNEIQRIYYDDVVSIKLVENYRIILTTAKLKGYQGSWYPAFWNVSLS